MEDSLRTLVDAVRAGDLQHARAILGRRPGFARMDLDNFTPLHYAVLGRNAELTRLLTDNGASVHAGIYPHRDATTPLIIATERGYKEIVGILLETEQRRGAQSDDGTGAPSLHQAAWMLDETRIRELLERGADVNLRGRHNWTPLDAAASRTSRYIDNHTERFAAVAALLRGHGAALTPRAAVALGDAETLGQNPLPEPVDGIGGLLTIAVTHNQPAMLTRLLELGLDPDERVRAEGLEPVEYSWGFPLWECAATGKRALAEILLRHGADPNAEVYASGTPVSEAYGQRDWEMVRLLELHGGRADAGTAALYRQTETAKRYLSEASDPRQAAIGMLGGAACGGDPELLRIALDYTDFPRDDPHWFGLLEQPLRVWNHGPGHWCRHQDMDRATYLSCFRMILDRCDPNLRGRGPDRGQFGLTILHSVCGARPHVTAGERLAFATILLNAGARLDIRDNLLKSTPLGWACRWGRTELVELFLARGADPVEPDAEPWASPLAWAEKKGHAGIVAMLRLGHS